MNKSDNTPTFDGVKLKKGEEVTQDTIEELSNGKGEDDE